MELTHLADYFMQEKFSDADLVILGDDEELVASTNDENEPAAKRAKLAAEAGDKVLAKFPAHRLALVGTDYFKAQAEAVWAPTMVDCSESAAVSCSRPQLQLTIGSVEQLPAAKAVIAALYCVQNAFSSLEHAQLVTAVVLADKIGAAAAAIQAVQMLQAAAVAKQGLPTAALDALASLTAWPACLQQLLLSVLQHANCCAASLTDLAAIVAADTGSRVQRMLLAVLGDLEAVWRDEQLQALLLQLPLPAVQLLLSSDQLRMASEDTVLYTATQYVAAQQMSRRQAARAVLAQLVRAPHLSGFALSCQAHSSTPSLLLGCYSRQLKLLASYKLVTAGRPVSAAALQRIPDVPESWMLGMRQLQATDGVRLEWRLPLDQLMKACKDSFAGNRKVDLVSPSQSPPMGGVAWQLILTCDQEVRDGVKGSIVGLFVGPHSAPADVMHELCCTVTGASTSDKLHGEGVVSPGWCGFVKFFGLAPMSAGGGWDEAAWAAAGLPVSGELALSLTMHSVGLLLVLGAPGPLLAM